MFYGLPIGCKENLQLLWDNNDLYREKAAKIVKFPYYSVSLLCVQVSPKKIMEFTYNIYKFHP